MGPNLNILLFEDEAIQGLSPITTGRPAYAIRCGGYRLIDHLQRLRESDESLRICVAVRRHLAPLQTQDFPWLEDFDTQDRWTMLVNARLVPTIGCWEGLQRLVRGPQVCRRYCGSQVAAAIVPTRELEQQGEAAHGSITWRERIVNYLADTRFRDSQNPVGGNANPATNRATTPNERSAESVEFKLFGFPHEVIRYHLECLTDSLQYRMQQARYQQQRDGLFVAESAVVDDSATVDCRNGPILIDEGAWIGPYCYLSGPAHIGAQARLIEHAAIKDNVSIGPVTKIGGEVEASIIDAYSNKQHHGFLGHSYLGSWINLGAGTCNSDLKNTYGEVKMEYDGNKVATGMQFIGCIMGDYSKTAINTGIFTGKTIGVCSMMYGFVTTNVPSFVNYARTFGSTTEVPPEVMISTQQRMFARRNVHQRGSDTQLIRDMYELTRTERDQAQENIEPGLPEF